MHLFLNVDFDKLVRWLLYFSFIKGLDMALLSLADHSILSYGTFGMWGALLAGKGEVTLPKDITKTDVGMAMRRAKISTWVFL